MPKIFFRCFFRLYFSVKYHNGATATVIVTRLVDYWTGNPLVFGSNSGYNSLEEGP